MVAPFLAGPPSFQGLPGSSRINYRHGPSSRCMCQWPKSVSPGAPRLSTQEKWRGRCQSQCSLHSLNAFEELISRGTYRVVSFVRGPLEARLQTKYMCKNVEQWGGAKKIVFLEHVAWKVSCLAVLVRDASQGFIRQKRRVRFSHLLVEHPVSSVSQLVQ